MKEKEKEKPQPERARKPYKKFLKRAIWPAISLMLSIIIVLLLLYKPAGYIPAEKAASLSSESQLSQNITNRLLPEFYNGIQQLEPFEMTINEEEINEIIAHAEWPKYSEGFIFYAPKASLSPGKVGFMCTILQFGLDVELVVTVQTEPGLDDEGLLNINVTEVKVGAVNITPLASYLGRRTYQQQKPDYIDPEDWRSKIAGSIFESAGFEPVFRIKDRWVRLEELEIKEECLRVSLKAVER
ncbi:MAG: hypothetical protein ACYSRQ_07290 [Planctomycetota bacterium]